MSDFNFNFKVGDKVYYPARSTQIYTLDSYDDESYPLVIVGEPSFTASFNHQGRGWDKHPLSSIFHATEENRRKLSELHGVDFEEPPVKPTSREIIQAKLNKSTEPVPCWVSNNPNCTQPTRKNVWAFIEDVDTDPSSKSPYFDSADKYWMYATPFDPHTNEAITELP